MNNIKQLTDNEVSALLEQEIRNAASMVGVDASIYPVKAMLKIRKYHSMACGFYLPLQNFSSLSSAKKSKNTLFYRYYFRIIKLKNRNEPLLEISKWTPSMGSVGNSKVFYRSDDPENERADFGRKLVSILSDIKTKTEQQ
jgi:hypothetical protein